LRRSSAPPAPPISLDVESLDLEGNGVAHHEGKVVFVRGGLPGETVLAEVVRRKPRFEVAQVVAVRRESSSRVRPRCPHFGVCGGCATQHIDARAQVAFKQRALEDTLWHLGRVRPLTVLPPIEGPAWGYRFRARLTARYVAKKGGVLVGFHERGSSFVADMTECHTMPAFVSDLLVPLRHLTERLSIRERMPQVEVAVGERDAAAVASGAASDAGQAAIASNLREPQERHVVALVFRVLDQPSAGDLAQMCAFGRTHGVEVWLQPKGPETAWLLCGAGGQTAAPVSELGYSLPEFQLRIPFLPTEFTQVNFAINRQLIARVVSMLDLRPDERAVDLFCGLGNFTLPLATRARHVLGIEGAPGLVDRARRNAQLNQAVLLGRAGEPDGVEFRSANLFEFDAASWQALGRVDKLLIDPPRDGALAIAQVLAEAQERPRRVVYVSCNPATLARDVGLMVNTGGWRLACAGVINMFPHTSHVESIAVLE
jgi:23S rRNA (uracil1939-C5)-methyltransferase